jgi:hypothetical protein
VKYSIDGKNINYCTLTIKDEVVADNLKVKITYELKAKESVELKLLCYGNKNQKPVASSKKLNVILLDDVVKSDQIEVISKYFDINEVLNLSPQHAAFISDFSLSYDENLFKKPANEWSNVEAKRVINFDQNESILYGRSLNHDFKSYSDRCKLEVDQIIDSRQLSEDNSVIYSKLHEKHEENLKLFIPERFHISDFLAVTKNLEKVAPKNTFFDVKYDLSQTAIYYTQKSTSYNMVEGVHYIENKSMKALDEYYCNEYHHDPYCSGNATFPRHFPVPKSANGYKFDPKSNVCNNSHSVGVDIVIDYNNSRNPYGDLCSDVTEKECYKLESYDACEGMGNPGMCGRDPYPDFFPNYTGRYSFEFETLSFYSPVKESSKRVVVGTGSINCSEFFPEIARTYSLAANWSISYAKTQWFIYDENWPNCGGLNCQKKVMRNAENDDRFQSVEPYKNECIDRWQSKSWSEYKSSLLSECKKSNTYIAAVNEYNRLQEMEALKKSCLVNARCSTAVKFLAKFFTKQPDKNSYGNEVTAFKKAIEAAKNAGKSFLILEDSPLVSDFNLAEEFLSHKDGIYDLANIWYENASYNSFEQLLSALSGVKTRDDFIDEENINPVLKSYQSLQEEVKTLFLPENKRLACTFSQLGRFKIYEVPEVTDIKLEKTDLKASGRLKSILDIDLEVGLK